MENYKNSTFRIENECWNSNTYKNYDVEIPTFLKKLVRLLWRDENVWKFYHNILLNYKHIQQTREIIILGWDFIKCNGLENDIYYSNSNAYMNQSIFLY